MTTIRERKSTLCNRRVLTLSCPLVWIHLTDNKFSKNLKTLAAKRVATSSFHTWGPPHKTSWSWWPGAWDLRTAGAYKMQRLEVEGTDRQTLPAPPGTTTTDSLADIHILNLLSYHGASYSTIQFHICPRIKQKGLPESWQSATTAARFEYATSRTVTYSHTSSNLLSRTSYKLATRYTSLKQPIKKPQNVPDFNYQPIKLRQNTINVLKFKNNACSSTERLKAFRALSVPGCNQKSFWLSVYWTYLMIFPLHFHVTVPQIVAHLTAFPLQQIAIRTPVFKQIFITCQTPRRKQIH